MEFIQPAEISGKIMTLIDQAKKELIIVSPYNKFRGWKKLTQRIEKARQRGVQIKWYIRKNIENNVEQIRKIGIEPIEIENLHCKLYLNEQHAVVTSMNLHEYSDSSSIDIGYLVTEKDKYTELVDFINLHLVTDTDKIKKVDRVVANKDVERRESKFVDLLITTLLDIGLKKEAISVHNNRYGVEVRLSDFTGNFTLIFEPKVAYYRIDLRIYYPYKIKKAIYNFLEEEENELNKLLGFEIDFGSHMKRLKLDLKVFKNYEYSRWGNEELEVLKPILMNVIATYRTYLKKAVEKYV